MGLNELTEGGDVESEVTYKKNRASGHVGILRSEKRGMNLQRRLRRSEARDERKN